MKYQFHRIEFECNEEGKKTIVKVKDEKNNFEKNIGGAVFPGVTPDRTNIKAFYKKGSQEEKLEFTLEDWYTREEQGQAGFKNTDIERLGDEFFEAEIPFAVKEPQEGGSVPLMSLEDVTEREFFNFNSISQSWLDDTKGGLWAFHGNRKFEFKIQDMPFAIHNKNQVDMKYSLYFDWKDNEELDEPIYGEDLVLKDFLSEEEGGEDKDGEFVFRGWFDSNAMGKTFTDTSQYHRFSGSLNLTCREVDHDFDVHTVVYSFPFSVIIHNTNYYKEEKKPCPLVDKNSVSIDFGTSSTCVAVWKGKGMELITSSSEKLLAEGEEINVYENPTNLMIADWDSIYQEWKEGEDSGFPHFAHGTHDGYKYENLRLDYDAGYTVRSALASGEKNVLDAILTQIKMLAYRLEQGDEIKVYPIFNEEVKTVNLVGDPKEQDKESLDAIAFYAYLLGRAINDPSKGVIYTKFAVTYPVKFNKSVRAKMLASLEYGLKRSLPLPLREAKDTRGNLFQVSMDYSEPVAFVGAVCGTYLKASLEDPALFAVYDFGGGTIDYAYGMFSVDEDDEGTIKIFGIDGDSDVGGESLISRISYWIYSDNLEVMKENLIPFEKPEEEQIPDDFPTKLLNSTNVAIANVITLNEQISRSLFQNKNGKLEGVGDDAFTETVVLVNESGDYVAVEVSDDYGTLVHRLGEIIAKTVENFSINMENNFRNNEEAIEKEGGRYDKDNVKIFKAGNSSRSILVEQKMKEEFPAISEKEHIYLVDETDIGKNKKYAINPKTAVAFGQLRLRSFDLEESDTPPFAWNIYSESVGDATFKPVLEKNTKEENWVRFGVVRRNTAEIYISDTIANTPEDPHFPLIIEGPPEAEDWSKNYLFLRVHDETSVEYCFSEKKLGNDCPSDTNPDCILVITEP